MKSKLQVFCVLMYAVIIVAGCQDSNNSESFVTPELKSAKLAESGTVYCERIYGKIENPDSVVQVEIREWNGESITDDKYAYKITEDKLDLFLSMNPELKEFYRPSESKQKSTDPKLSSDIDYVYVPPNGNLFACASSQPYWVSAYENGWDGYTDTYSSNVSGTKTHTSHVGYMGVGYNDGVVLYDSVYTAFYVHWYSLDGYDPGQELLISCMVNGGGYQAKAKEVETAP